HGGGATGPQPVLLGGHEDPRHVGRSDRARDRYATGWRLALEAEVRDEGVAVRIHRDGVPEAHVVDGVRDRGNEALSGPEVHLGLREVRTGGAEDRQNGGEDQESPGHVGGNPSKGGQARGEAQTDASTASGSRPSTSARNRPVYD